MSGRRHGNDERGENMGESSSVLSELEARLAATFETGDWSLEPDVTAGDVDLGDIQESAVREINMDLIPLGGSRPRAN
jgi:hypothetical protein